MLAIVGQIDKIAAKDPARAREVLAGVIELAILTPGPDGYEIALTLNDETAALASGRTIQHGFSAQLVRDAERGGGTPGWRR